MNPILTVKNISTGKGLKILVKCLWVLAFILPLFAAASFGMNTNAIVEIFGRLMALSFVVIAFEKLFSRKSPCKKKILYYLIWGILMICVSLTSIGEMTGNTDTQKQTDKEGN